MKAIVPVVVSTAVLLVTPGSSVTELVAVVAAATIVGASLVPVNVTVTTCTTEPPCASAIVAL